MCDKVTGGGGSKLVKNSVTYFMDGPKDMRKGKGKALDTNRLCTQELKIERYKEHEFDDYF